MSEVRVGKFEGFATHNGIGRNKKAYTLYSAIVDGTKLSLGFDNALFSEIPTGQPVSVTVSKDPKGYWQVESVEKLDKLPETATQSSPVGVPHSMSGPVPGKVDYSQVDRREALQIAASIVNATCDSPHAKRSVSDAVRVNRVVAWADHFVRYIQTGRLDPVDLEAVKKLEEAIKET